MRRASVAEVHDAANCDAIAYALARATTGAQRFASEWAPGSLARQNASKAGEVVAASRCCAAEQAFANVAVCSDRPFLMKASRRTVRARAGPCPLDGPEGYAAVLRAPCARLDVGDLCDDVRSPFLLDLITPSLVSFVPAAIAAASCVAYFLQLRRPFARACNSE